MTAEFDFPPPDGLFSSLSSREDTLAFDVIRTGSKESFHFSGALIVYCLNAVEEAAREAVRNARAPIVINLTAVTRLDTAGALLVNLIAEDAQKRGKTCEIISDNGSHRNLLQASRLISREQDAERADAKACFFLRFLNAVGLAVCRQINFLGRLIGFMGHFLFIAAGLLFRPRLMRWTSLFFHVEQTGIRAVPIVSLLTFLIGMVVAYMGAEQLSRFAGAQIFAVKLLEVTILREMAVLITAIVVAGRSSSSFTAQIGAMVANGEVAAMLSMGLEPNTLLVAPRVLALLISLPMLVLVADLSALSGGAVAIWYTMGMSINTFISELHAVAELRNFTVGLAKTPFFAVVIGLIGCFQGLQATSRAESVGFLTTISVVQAIFLIILLDALFAIFFTALGV
ncbi:MAG: ABC transporter permease [Desulfovibrio sp.]|nr:ABC transporter permease [Desulfovibrio sp.]